MWALDTTDEQTLNEGTSPIRQVQPDRLPHPAREELELATVLHALSDPVRLQIVATLANGHEWSCGNLGLPVGKSTCSHHLAVLREAGVIVQRVDGTRKLNSLRRDDLDVRFPGLLDAVVAGAPPPTPATPAPAA